MKLFQRLKMMRKYRLRRLKLSTIRMTPKEKAKQLVEKFRHIDGRYIMMTELACQCALGSVEEIDMAIDFDWMEVQNLDRVHKYWFDVRSEIFKIAST